MFALYGKGNFSLKVEVNKRRIFYKSKFNCPMDDYRDEAVVVGVRNVRMYHGDKLAKMYFSYNPNMKFLLSNNVGPPQRSRSSATFVTWTWWNSGNYNNIYKWL